VWTTDCWSRWIEYLTLKYEKWTEAAAAGWTKNVVWCYPICYWFHTFGSGLQRSLRLLSRIYLPLQKVLDPVSGGRWSDSKGSFHELLIYRRNCSQNKRSHERIFSSSGGTQRVCRSASRIRSVGNVTWVALFNSKFLQIDEGYIFILILQYTKRLLSRCLELLFVFCFLF